MSDAALPMPGGSSTTHRPLDVEPAEVQRDAAKPSRRQASRRSADLPAWWFDMPAWARKVLQTGAVGLIIWLYVDGRNDGKKREEMVQQQLADQYRIAAEQAREDRAMFREALAGDRAANDRRFDRLAEKIEAQTELTRRAVDRLDEAHNRIKQDVKEIKAGLPVPEPRPKEQP